MPGYETNSDQILSLSADTPQTDPSHDCLGYAPFARHLARSLSRMSPSEGLVAAIFAPWGAGKTTLLNFVEYYLRHAADSQAGAEQVESATPNGDASPVGTLLVMHFNPWWFSGHEDLTNRFFNQLLTELGEQKKFKDIRTKIADLAGILGESSIPYTGIFKAIAKASQPASRDVFKLKDDVSKALSKQNLKILVVIDDLDRLTVEEIRQMFRLVKAVANFPNVLYLMAFDKAIAVEAVGQFQGSNGEAYLEKIIQVSFDLPLPDPSSLRSMFLEKLDHIIAGTLETLANFGYWGNVFYDGIEPFLQTPRDVIRLTNSLQVTYPAVVGEVNPVDFIALETLRIFQPAVYDNIRKNPEMFTGNTDRDYSSVSQDILKKFHEAWLERVASGDQETVKNLMLRLFPKAEQVWKNVGHDSDWEPKWRRDLRACSSSIFPVYFRLTVPSGTLSQAEIQSILAATGDTINLEELLLDFNKKKHPDGTTMARAVLERLQDYTDEVILLDSIPAVILALANAGDEMIASEVNSGSMFDLRGIEVQIWRIFGQLLGRLDEPSRFEVLHNAVQYGRAIGTLASEVMVLGRQHGKNGGTADIREETRLVNAEHLSALETLVSERIRDAADSGALLAVKTFHTVLSAWSQWENEEAPRAWIQQLISSDDDLLMLLGKMVRQTRSQGMGEAVIYTQLRLNPNWIKPYADSDQVAHRLMELRDKKKLSQSQSILLNQYLEEYDLIQKGRDPDFLI